MTKKLLSMLVALTITKSFSSYAGDGISSFTVGGVVRGMSGSGLTLQLNGENDYHVLMNGKFTFAPITDRSNYTVTVKMQPATPPQGCTVDNGVGVLNGNDVTNVSVTCSPWTKQVGRAGGYTGAYAVATDNAGNIFVAGATQVGLDEKKVTGNTDLFLIKYNAVGNMAFTSQLGVAGVGTVAQSVATDADGNVYVSGYTYGAFENNSTFKFPSLFLVKYDATGRKVYTRQLGVKGARTYATSVAADSDGNVFVAGYTSGGLDGNTLMGSHDLFLTKYNTSGTKVYTKQFGVTRARTTASAVATDANGSAFVVGSTGGDLDSGKIKKGGPDFFLIKYSAAGERIYKKQMGSKNGTLAHSVTTDRIGNVFVSGYTVGGLDGNKQVGYRDLFLTKYNPAGEKIYTKQMGVTETSFYPNSMAIDRNSNIFIAGWTKHGLEGDIMSDNYESFLTKYSNSGDNIYTKQMGLVDAEIFTYSVSTDVSGNVFIAGHTTGGLDGNTQKGTQDLFLVKYDNTGNKQ